MNAQPADTKPVAMVIEDNADQNLVFTMALNKAGFSTESIHNGRDAQKRLREVVPHIVIAIGYYAFLADVGLLQTLPGLVLAHTALSVPVAFLVLSASLKGFDRTLERAAMSLGAPPWKAFLHVTVPAVGRSMPAMQLSSVVLPQPDAPRATRKSPSFIVRSTGASACSVPPLTA